MKVRINRNEYMASCWYRNLIGEVLNVEDYSESEYKIVGSDLRISKYHAKVVEDVEKSCDTCKYEKEVYCEMLTDRRVCSNHNLWQPIESTEKSMRETADPSKIIKGSEQRKEREQIVINSKGAKQSKIDTAFSLVPHDSLLAVAKVMKIGSERYEKDNWRQLSTDEIYDHLMEHLVKWHMTGNMEDLEHGVARAMMLYSVANDGQ